MGLEFLGGGGPAADLEVIAIAIECMEAVGVTDFVLALGHAGVVTSLLDEVGFPIEDSRREVALRGLSRRDPLALTQALAGAGGSDVARQALVSLAEDGGIRQSLDQARAALRGMERARVALDDLESVTQALSEAGLKSRVAIDLSESRGLDYYTGLVFRVYGAGLGFEVGGGGRYDSLLGRLGRPMPAIGFMLGLDRLAVLAERQHGGGSSQAAPGTPAAGETLGRSLQRARELRSRRQKIQFRGLA
jgi:ATP phosphoribosyltransferase regulatory subunit